MEKMKFRLSLGFLIFSATSLLVMLLLSMRGIYLYIGNPPSGIPYHFLNCLFLIVVCVSGVYIVHSKFRDKGLTAMTIVGSFFILTGTFIYGLFALDTKLTTFSSPTGQEHFLIIEAGVGNLYQLSNTNLFMTHLTTIPTDNGFKPFSSEAYELEWEDTDELVIKYGFASYLLSEEFSEIKVNFKPFE